MRLRLRLHVLVLVGLVVGLLGSMSGSASAAFTYSFGASLERSGEPFRELIAGSVAVDDENGKTYVADSGRGEVAVFETSSGTQLASLDSSLTPAGSFGEHEVAVAANNATGDVYVLDTTDGVVDVFDGTGGYVCQITGSSTPSASECNGAAGSDTPAHSFTAWGITVDQATGDVYVLDSGHGALDIFSAGGAYLRQTSLASIPGFNGAFTRGVAVDDFNGNVYVTNSFGDVVYVLNAAGDYLTTWTGSNTPAHSFGHGYVSVAADNATGEVYVTDSADQVTNIFTPSGEYLTQISPSSIDGRGTAIDQANHNVYISDFAASAVFVFDAVVVPDVATEPASNVQPRSATLNGTVNPDGLPVTSCVFEYGTETSYGQSVPCAQSVGSGTSPVAVSADLSGLQEGTTYHFRLVVENANGPNQGADVQVTVPAPPSVESATVENLGASAADLRAAINPHAAASTYRIEYGTSTAYGTSVPVPDGAIAAGLIAQTVTQHVSGLQANTTYHWRVVAQNLAGTTTGGDHTFIYSTGGGGLPDNRAYEMVTPPQKNAALFGQRDITFVYPDISEDGSRVVARSQACLADAESCSVLRGYASGEPYAMTRTSGGWVTSPLAPSATQLGNNTSYMVNAEAGTALFSVATPPAGEDDWYARGAGGAFADIGPLSSPSQESISTEPNLLLATADFSHLVWQATVSGHWPFDPLHLETTTAGLTVYDYAGAGNAAPSLVGVSGGPGSTDLVSSCETYLPTAPGALSADGRTVFFTASPCSTGRGVNVGVPVPADELYARIEGSRSVFISGRSPADCKSAACLASPAGNAWFQGASADASKVFFTSTQQLTDSASEDNTSGDSTNENGCAQTVGVNGCNLYEYDFAAPAGHNLVAVSAGDSSGGGPRVQGVTAVSQDGSHVYFVAQGVLTAAGNGVGQTAVDGGENLYVYERDATFPGGHMAFVATLSDARAGFSGSDSTQWAEPGGARVMDVTPDGRFLVFTSSNALTPDDTSTTGASQVFRYDAQTGELVRISIGDQGFNDNGNHGAACSGAVCGALAASIVPPTHGERAGAPRLDPTMSHDGSFVFFESPAALAPGALDNVQIATEGGTPIDAQNVYEYHAGRVYLISDGKDLQNRGLLSDVRLIGSDATGANVFFMTSDPLVAQDTDTQQDIYDARVCTASEPCTTSPPLPLACQGEACHGTAGVAPVAPGAGSAAFAGPGNLAALPVGKAPAAKKRVVRCVKGKRLTHGRCVKAHRKKKGKRASAKRAKANHGGKK